MATDIGPLPKGIGPLAEDIQDGGEVLRERRVKLHQLAGLGIDGALEHQQARMRLRQHLPGRGVIVRHRQVFGARIGAP